MSCYPTHHCIFKTNCDPLWEKVHFCAKCNIEIRVKIAESGPLAVKPGYDTVENYSLSSTFSRWSDVRASLLAVTASPQRREVQFWVPYTARVNDLMRGAGLLTSGNRRVVTETLRKTRWLLQQTLQLRRPLL